jgi:hypothetical protein
MAYDNTNRWTLNKNAGKQQETHADYNGKINVEGKDYWLNGWIKDGPNGKFISGSIKAVGEQAQPAKTYPADRITTGRLPPKQSIMPEEDSEIPF